ncbi:histidine phosphatase family protein [Teichococcus oryzae]|uniref:Histidine phosphatase family protein n=1 Tax=Teichococcus oryzae TaxID=1608942 RepID=A0A5B2TBQ9_9PROT|nr:histidine phosphatase family protein [Pseudoroseomonas oryzae]KAA2211942.1 histidine phosphatase family protein [Pseudoroseomonas oryzae]
MAMTLFLLRHAAHDRVADTLCGRMPGVALGGAGLAQADALAARLHGEGIEALYTSPVQRCHETAAPIGRALGLDPLVDDALTEIDFGDWTGRRFTELLDDPQWRHWNSARDDAAPPCGESMRAAQRRVMGWITAAHDRHPDGRVAMVSHGDVIKAALCFFLDLPLQAYERFDIAPASLSALVVWQGGGRVLCLNEQPPAKTEMA